MNRRIVVTVAICCFSISWLMGGLNRSIRATPASFDWGSFNAGGSTAYGIYDVDNATILQTGDLAQLIWTGPNGVIDPPQVSGAPGGDDQLLSTNTVNNGAPFPPPQQNKGYLALKTYSFDTEDPQNEGLVYIRAWNAPSASGANAYGDSVQGTLSNGGVLNAPRWNTNVEISSATPTPTSSSTNTTTPSPTTTSTSTATATVTPTESATATSTSTAVYTPTSTSTETATPSATSTGTTTATNTPTATPVSLEIHNYLPMIVSSNHTTQNESGSKAVVVTITVSTSQNETNTSTLQTSRSKTAKFNMLLALGILIIAVGLVLISRNWWIIRVHYDSAMPQKD